MYNSVSWKYKEIIGIEGIEGIEEGRGEGYRHKLKCLLDNASFFEVLPECKAVSR